MASESEVDVEINNGDATESFPSQPPSEEPKRWEFYEILGAERNANLDTLRKARKKLALKNHPDKNRKNPEEAQVEIFCIINYKIKKKN